MTHEKQHVEVGLQGHLEQMGNACLPHSCPQGAEMQLGRGTPRLKGILEEKNCIPSGKNPRHKAGVGLLGIMAALMAHEAAPG